MLKNLLKAQKNDDGIFPLQKPALVETNNGSNNIEIKSVAEVSKKLLENEGFMHELAELVTTNVLEILIAKYNFEPSTKYLEDMENKKKYINQLDAYLQERREIHNTVENDLQKFLLDTTQSFNKALEAFSTNISSRIRDAENRHGIEAMKEALLVDTQV